MFDLGWTELLVVAVVAIVIVGPKDLPRALRAVGKYTGKARRMAGDFQRQFNDAVREADLDDVKKSVTDIGKIDPLGDIRKEMSKAEAGIKSDLQKATKLDTPAKVEAKSDAAPEPAKPAAPSKPVTPAEPAAAATTETPKAPAAKAKPKKASTAKAAPKKPAASKAAPKKTAAKAAPKKPAAAKPAASKKPVTAEASSVTPKAPEAPATPAPAPANAAETTGDAKP
ncbi:Sec-independent protein translocase protein TatB [Bauldia litoralis]|uniref:Sec-independent protein translocase protein TatB n=1 Tax=Bauldia litoralis TaxID=665467 RepID=A0A1G6AU04_9HYPH|nr:Sec-independent protein translocase protein TatB [Bauldia litoralis]SDB11822.1 sec-independent protein translocase protein TatB [Bauldia litoralis]